MSNEKLAFVALQSIAYSSISSSYAAVGSQYTVPLYAFRIVNNTDGDMIISTDSTVSAGHLFVPANSFVLYDLTANSPPNFRKNLPGYIQFWVKYSSAPSTGSLYIEALY